eukprot:CAMPEP_0179884870 /NCGR_PEP_ID=MMETSP0982-20121206/29945_1 /TAXON_ID=483367 /ORGANISM="non described non described, Strain CCMP 2436" /LENGTH=200 /DNA_ID=CAMNT_0021780347 /DNA_START=145 /DNA_END=743 /DNA_ORIENTATION=+
MPDHRAAAVDDEDVARKAVVDFEPLADGERVAKQAEEMRAPLLRGGVADGGENERLDKPGDRPDVDERELEHLLRAAVHTVRRDDRLDELAHEFAPVRRAAHAQQCHLVLEDAPGRKVTRALRDKVEHAKRARHGEAAGQWDQLGRKARLHPLLADGPADLAEARTVVIEVRHDLHPVFGPLLLAARKPRGVRVADFGAP